MKKKIIFLSIFIFILAIGGVAAFYFTKANQNPIVYGKGEVAKYKTDTRPVPTDGTTPLDHDSYANIAYILWLLEHTDQYSSLTEGTAVSVGQKQVIYNHRRVNGKEQLVDTVSSGLVSLGKQKYFKDGKVLIRDYISKKDDLIQWKTEEPECISNSQYIVRYGWLPTQATAYIICKETILEISEIALLEDGNYSIQLSLNPDRDYAPFWYQREVATNASSLSEAKFSSIHVEYIFDSAWRILQVNTQETYEVEPKVAPLSVKCNTNITEIFTYAEPDFGSAKDFFDQYKDLKPSDGEELPPAEENTPLSYITGSLLGGDLKEHFFKVNLRINDKVIEGKLSLDISDLNDISVKVSLGELQVVYDSKEVFIDYNTIKLKCNIEESAKILQPLLEELMYGDSPSDISSGFDVSQIISDINSATMIETENQVTLNVTLHLLGISLPLTFDIHKNGDELDLNSIKSHLEFQDYSINVDICKQNNIAFKPIDGEYNDLNNIDFIIKDITKILKNKKFSVNFYADYKNLILEGTAYIPTQKDSPLKLDLLISNPQNNIKEEVSFIYASNTVYVTYKDNKIKLSISALQEFLIQQGLNVPEITADDLQKLLESLSSIDFKSLLKQLIIKEDELFLELDLSTFDEKLGIVTAKVKDTEQGFSIATNLFDLNLEFDTQKEFTIDEDLTSYVELDGYLGIANYLMNLIGKKSIGLNLNGYVTINQKPVQLSSCIRMYLVGEVYQIDGDIQFNLDGNLVGIHIIYQKDYIYLQAYGYTLKLDVKKLSSTLDEIMQALDMNSINVDMPGISELLDFLSKVQIGENWIEADMSKFSELLGKFMLSFSLNKSILNMELSSNSSKVNIELKEISSKEIQLPEEYYTEEDLLAIVAYAKDIKQIIEQKHVSLRGSLEYEDIKVEFDVYIEYREELKAIGKVIIQYAEEVFELEVAYENSTLYISYKNIKLKIESNRLMEYLPKLELPSLGIEEIITYFKGIKLEDNQIKLEVGKEEIIELVLKDTAYGFDIKADAYKATIKVDVQEETEIKIEDSAYTNIEGYLDIVDYLLKNIGKESFGIEIEAAILLQDKPLSISGQINMYQANGYSIEGALRLSYDNIVLDLVVLGVDKDIYIQFLGYTFLLNLDTLPNTIQLILKELGVKHFEPCLSLKEILCVLDSLEVNENGIQINFERLGLIGISLTKNQDQIFIDVATSKLSINALIHPMETKEIQLPEEYYTEEDLLAIVAYAKDIKQIIEQKHVSLRGSLEYEDIKVDFDVYIEYREELKAIGKVTIQYAEEVFELEVAYANSTLYISYKNIKLKIESNRLMEYLPKLELPSLGIEEIITYFKGIKLEDNQIKLEVGKEEIIELVLKDTAYGFDIKADAYKATIKVDVQEEKEIKIENSAYTNIEGYLDIVDYLLKNIGKESFGIEIEAAILLQDKPLSISGSVEFLFNENSYDIFSTLHLDYSGITLDVELAYMNQRIYMKVYENVIELSITDFEEILYYIFERMNISLNNLMPSLSLINELLETCLLTENTIEINLSLFMQNLSKVLIEFNLVDTLSIVLKQENLFYINLSQKPISIDKIPVYHPTLVKQDLYTIIDDIFFAMDIVSSKAIHMDFAEGNIQFSMGQKLEEISLSGYVDILLKELSVEVSGHFTVQGLGCLFDIDVIYLQNVLYLTVANQTICIELTQLDGFLVEAKQILEPIYALDISMPKLDLEIDIEALNLLLSANTLKVDLTELLGKACEFSVIFGVAMDLFELEMAGSVENISFNLPIHVSKSNVKEIKIPDKNYLTLLDILVILNFVVDGYNLINEKEFNFNFTTSLYANGSLSADVEGDLYLRLLENGSFDAHFKAIVQQYGNNEPTQWHQIDLQVISLETMRIMNPDIDCGMIYGYYGNNPMDTSAVVKVKSTYTGIEALIEMISKLLNIQLPAMDTVSTSIFDIRNLFNLISVEEDRLHIQINVNSLFDEIQHEIMDLILTKQNGLLASLEASNVYLSYTSTKKHLKLDSLKLSLVPHSLDIAVPNDSESYYDISNISNLFEAFYNNALEKNFEISGTVTLTAMSIVNVNMPISIKINVDENGMPVLYAHLNMTNLGLGSMLMSKKHVYIYYKDEYVYIHRDDAKDKDDRKIKIHYTEFLNNIMYYLMDYAMGLPDSILSLINKTPEGDGFVDAAGCINDLKIGTNEFMVNLNMKELADNYDLGKMIVALASTLVAKTDDQGNYILDAEGNILYAPMIYQIPNFEFVAVDVINLNSKNLILSNIKEDSNGNLVVHDVDLSELDAYISDFDSNFNTDEEYIYSNGAWVSNGKLKHNVVFDLDEAGSIVKRYSESSKVDFPYEKNDIFSASTDSGMRYYRILGWYLDSSYKQALEDTTLVYMGNKSLAYYAKLLDVTIELSIQSNFDEEFNFTTYEGADISSIIEEKYNIKNLDSGVYKFIGLQNETGNFIDLMGLKRGSYRFTAQWEKLEYDFYAIYNNQITKLDENSDVPFLEQDYIIQKNNEYLLYSYDKLTPRFIITAFANLFILNEDLQRFELNLISLEDNLLKDYDQITFETPREEFNAKGYYGFLIPKNTSKDISGLLPNGTYDSYEINAWVADGTYYTLADMKNIRGSYHFSAYVSTKLSYFEFETISSGATITKYTGTSSLVIFPEYALLGGVYLPVVELKEMLDDNKAKISAFTSNATVQTIVTNESLMFIGSNAFKNCTSLKSIYISEAVSTIASDAFYYTEGNSWGKNSYAQALSIRFLYQNDMRSALFSGEKLLAFKDLGTKYYSKKYTGCDLRNSLIDELGNVLSIAYSSIRNL